MSKILLFFYFDVSRVNLTTKANLLTRLDSKRAKETCLLHSQSVKNYHILYNCKDWNVRNVHRIIILTIKSHAI